MINRKLLLVLGTAASIAAGTSVATAQPTLAQPPAPPAVTEDLSVPSVAPAAAQCGFYTQSVGGAILAFWRTCDLYGQQLTVDVAFAPDYQICAPIGPDTALGPATGAGSVRGATVIGRC